MTTAGSAARACGLLAGAAVSALVVASCHSDPVRVPDPALPGPLPPLAAGELAIVGASVVPMTGPEVLEQRTIVIRDGLIAEVGPASEVAVPAGAAVVDGEGLWVAPGLVDMHAHVRVGDLAAYRSAGITTIRNMWGTPVVAELRLELAAGADHPAVFSAAPGFDGQPPVWPGSVVLTEPAAARDAVRRHAADGWDFIKVYNRLRPEVLAAILDEGARVGIKVVGHVPLASDVETATAAGLAGIDHLTGIAEVVADGRGPAGWLRFDPDAAGAVARMLADRGVWVCPTLAILRHLADRNLPPDEASRATEHQRAMVRALRGAGVALLAGTDAGLDAVPAGSTLATELELMVQAGLTPYEALRTATRDAARFLGVADAQGTIEPGMRADLVLLRADPLEDIGAVREPVGLIQRGKRLF